MNTTLYEQFILDIKNKKTKHYHIIDPTKSQLVVLKAFEQWLDTHGYLMPLKPNLTDQQSHLTDNRHIFEKITNSTPILKMNKIITRIKKDNTNE